MEIPPLPERRIPRDKVRVRAYSRLECSLQVLAKVVAREKLTASIPIASIPETTDLDASIQVSKPYKKRIIKNDLYHKLMRQARKYKHPTAQQSYKSKISRKKYQVRNKSALKNRNKFVYKARQRMHLTSTLSLIAGSLKHESP